MDGWACFFWFMCVCVCGDGTCGGGSTAVLGRGRKVFALGMGWAGWVGVVKGMERTGYWSGNSIPHFFGETFVLGYWYEGSRQVQALVRWLVGCS
jgi:hypothetical protein